MRIAVVGVGAMGCLLGAYLSRVSSVVLIGHWPEQLVTLTQDGLRLEKPDGTREHYELAATADPLALAPFDVALVVVKSRQTAEAAATIAELLAPEGLALTLQNGLNNRATLRRTLGAARVTLGVTSEGATVLGPGAIRHAGHGPTFIGLDAALGSAQQARLPALADLFNQAGFETSLVENIDSLVWSKLAVNAAINPLTALMRVPNGFLIEHDELIDLMHQTATEVTAVAAAQGIPLPSDAGERAVAVARATAANHSSMLQDVLRGAPTEIEAICGAVTRVGRQAGVPTPLNARLCRLVRQLEDGRPPLADGDVSGLLRLLRAGR